jgi:alkylhydroperoxidase/carboxymuconolactone decarboxylase family protein YurZ
MSSKPTSSAPRPAAPTPVVRTSSTPTIDELRATGRWNPLWDRLAKWDPEWTELMVRSAIAPWKNQVLPARTIELICIAGNVACSHLYAPGARRHIRAALAAGATRDEILAAVKLAALIGFQAIQLGVPLLAQELGEPHRSVLLQLRDWDSTWATQMSIMTASPRCGALEPKTVELICIGINAAATHLNADAVRCHIRAALAVGATRDEIVEVLKVATNVGVHACNLAVPILAEELAAQDPSSEPSSQA